MEDGLRRQVGNLQRQLADAQAATAEAQRDAAAFAQDLADCMSRGGPGGRDAVKEVCGVSLPLYGSGGWSK